MQKGRQVHLLKLRKDLQRPCTVYNNGQRIIYILTRYVDNALSTFVDSHRKDKKKTPDIQVGMIYHTQSTGRRFAATACQKQKRTSVRVSRVTATWVGVDC